MVRPGRRSIAVGFAAMLCVAILVPVSRADGGARAEEVTAGFGAVWTTGASGIVRIDPRSGRITAHVNARSAGLIPSLATGEGAVWMLTRHQITRIDPVRDRVVGHPIQLRRLSVAFAVGAGAVWVADYNDGVLREFDPRTAACLRPSKMLACTSRRSWQRGRRSG